MRQLLFVIAAGLGATLLVGCNKGVPADAAADAITALGKQLPAPYRDDLVTESAQQQGKDVVLVIRAADITVAMAKAKPDVFDALRLDEQAAITELCVDPLLTPVLAAGGKLHRRFIDRDGASFFDATLTPSDCQTH